MSTAWSLESIWEDNRTEVLAQVDVIADAVIDALTGPLPDDVRLRAAREAHKLAGSVGTLGFGAASKHARTLEEALGEPGGPRTDDLPRLARLTVALRRELTTGGPARPVVASDQPALGEATTLLVVDDDDRRRRSLLAAAAASGIRALPAGDLETGRRLIAEVAPEVVLLSLSIGGDRNAAMRFLTDASTECPVMVTTSAGEEVDRVDVARHGGRSFLDGSLGPSETITEVLDLRARVRIKGTRILAVDDEPVVLAALEAVLGDAGLTVETCSDPARFWERLNDVAPDLVLLDFDLPSISGPELCRAMRNESRWAGLPVIFLTARTDAASVRTVFEAGADDYLAKPFVGPEVVARIGNRLERVRLYRALADTDSLTGLLNRRASVDALETLLRLGDRHHQPVALAVLDVDQFKSINDDHGHAAGDVLLRELGVAMRHFFRGEDVVARWGGDELMVGMYGMTAADGCERLGDFAEVVRSRRFDAGRLAVTLSAGVAEYPRQGADVDGLYHAADAALYLAKAEGRDRVVPAARVAEAGTAVTDVVVVEDDPVLGRLLEHALQTRGYRTRWITDGVAAAAELASAGPADAPLVLLDWDLPGLDGLRVLRGLRDGGVLERTRVIMLTARGAEHEVLEALEAGAVDHVTKPFSVPVLMQRVRRALER